MEIMRVIFIDDDKDLNFLQERMCIRSKFIQHYYISSSGPQTLDYLREVDSPPDIIFVDINMPVMDGFEFIEEFERRFLKQFPETVLFVLSSSVRENDKIKAMGYPSVKGFLSKPLLSNQLEEIFHLFRQS